MKYNAKKWLEMAIKRHQRHMDGKEPTTGKIGAISQMLMMEEMKMAFKALSLDTEVEASMMYINNKDKV